MQANDQQLEEMGEKVAALKQFTIDIGREAKMQNAMLNNMEDDFSSAGSLLDVTVKRLGEMMNTGGSNHMCYLVAFIFGLFMFIYLFLR